MAGMKGTGSNTLVADEVFVPDHRLLSVPKGIENEYPTEHKDEALYRSSFIPVLALILVGPQLGLARAARDLCIAKAPKRAISYTSFERQTDSVAFQLEVAKAAMKVDTAHLHAFRAAGDIDAAAARGDKLDYVTRARVRADTGYTADTARAAIDALRLGARRVELRRLERDAADLARLERRRPPRGGEPDRELRGLRQGAAGRGQRRHGPGLSHDRRTRSCTTSTSRPRGCRR